jgi:hypothetical protein
MNYIELFGYPLSGKSTLLRNLDETSPFKYNLSKTDRSIYRMLSTIWFLLINRDLIHLYLKLPIKKYNFFSSIRKFFSFASNYKEYLKFQASTNKNILDEGLCQGIWGLLTFFDYEDYRKEITILVNLYFETLLINNNFIVVKMNHVNFDEFKRRSLKRPIHHSYIVSKLNRNNKKLDIYNFSYELILNKVMGFNSLINQQELINYIK